MAANWGSLSPRPSHNACSSTAPLHQESNFGSLLDLGSYAERSAVGVIGSRPHTHMPLRLTQENDQIAPATVMERAAEEPKHRSRLSKTA